MDDRFSVVTIVFKPEVQIAEDDTVSILGEFSNWMPEIMERYDTTRVLMEPELANTFFYKTKLLRQWKYRYQFSVGDTFVIDTTKESSECERTGRMTNFVTVNEKSLDKAASEERKYDEDLEAALVGLDGSEEEVKLAAKTKSEDELINNMPAPPDIFSINQPSYVNVEMNKFLPKEITSKVGKRVLDTSMGSLCELLKRHHF